MRKQQPVNTNETQASVISSQFSVLSFQSVLTAGHSVTVTAHRTTAVTVTVTADSRQQQNFLNNRQQTTVTVWSDDV